MTRRDAELRQRDARARELAQTRFDRPLVLEAGAGTGKTTALVARVAAWSLGSGWERAQEASSDPRADRIARRVLSGIVAITFTEAAAAEMSRRVGDALHEIEQGRVPLGLLDAALPASDARRERARALRGALDHLVATTIHAWCRRLLVAHPLDAGLHAHLEIDADGRLGKEVAREVLEPRLRDAYAAGNARLLALAERRVGPREIEEEILALLEAGFPARTLAEDPFSRERVGALAERLARAAEAVREAGAPLAGARARVSAETVACAARVADRLRDEPVATRSGLMQLVAWLSENLDDTSQTRLREWARKKFGAGDAAALGESAARLARASADLVDLVGHARQIDVERLDLGRSVFGELLGEVEEVLRARGVASFHDLIEGASRLVAGNARVAAAVRAQIDQLLVDEFQDTDRRQCDLLRAVALTGPEASRPGLFVVGDPKQSIYGWRSADLTAYDAFVADVRAAGGEREILYVNYRSVPAVLREVDRVVAPVMREHPGLQPRFEPLVPSDENAPRSGFTTAGHRPAEYWVAAECDGETGAPQPTRVTDASKLEARALARELRALHDDAALPWGSFGVLFRSRSDWDVYLAALREHAVPFAVEGDRSYYRRREIVDAAALVRCVLDPNDHLALVTMLRSAAVGVPDAALIPLWAGDLPRQLSALHAPDPERLASIRRCAEGAALPEDVPGLERVAGWRQSLVAAARALAELRRSAHEDPVDVFVETLRTSLLLEASEAARFQGAWRAANLDRFFRELLADLDGGADFHRVLRRLRAALADEQDAAEGRPREILEDAVQLLTIHGAKGLDFEHVYVMQLHKGPPPKRAARVEIRAVGGDLEYRVLGAPTPGWDRAEKARHAVEEAERVRTLYVAMTRAKTRLVLSGLWPDLARSGSGRSIDLIASSLEGAEFPERLNELAAQGAHDGVDEAGARWVLPALAPGPPEQARAAARPLAALANETEIAAASERLQAARREMAARMARPLGAAASDDPHENPEDSAERGWSRGGGVGFAGRGESVAAAVGTAVHRALEAFDFGAEPAAELERVREIAASALRAQLPADRLEEGRARLGALLERLAAGPLLERLRALAPHIVARELPVLVAPGEQDEAVGYVSGALDLVYADPGSGRLVVADYKTGARRDYGRQGARYRRALREALGLVYEPRFELWYLEEDAVVAG